MALTNAIGQSTSTLGNIILGIAARNEAVPITLPVDLPLTGQAVTFTTANPASGEAVAFPSGRILVVGANTDSVDHSFIVSSALDSFNRHGDITDTIAAGTLRLLGPFAPDGWSQAFRAQLWLWAESALVSFAVVEVA